MPVGVIDRCLAFKVMCAGIMPAYPTRENITIDPAIFSTAVSSAPTEIKVPLIE
jgi:hypothetical protein